jgi:hypothetical protein
MRLAQKKCAQWLKANKNLNATLRLNHRITDTVRSMESSVLEYSMLLEAMKTYKWSTILRYTRIALSHHPNQRHTPQMRARLAELTARKNEMLLKRKDPALTLEQLKAAVGTRRSTEEYAVWVTWVTASRLKDWEATKLRFHPDAVEVRYVRRWKTDPRLNRRVVKWIPLGGDSRTRWRQAWKCLRTPHGRAAVIAHISRRTGRATGHAIRHAAIRRLEALGQPIDSVTKLTFHRTGPSSALEVHYLAKWSPREASGSRTCFRMATLLRRALPSFA